ncbi:MAG: VOC family protein [Calditrichia bacterium]
MGAPVVHFEIIGRDAARLREFYSKAFDWKINANNPIGYGLVPTQREKNSIGGGIAADDKGGKGFVTFYVEVPDVQAALDKIESLGGKTVTPPTTVPGMVTYAHFVDPEGHLIGLVQSGQPE